MQALSWLFGRDADLRRRRSAVPEQDHRQGCGAPRIGQNDLAFQFLDQG
jgi:hypothetical protein